MVDLDEITTKAFQLAVASGANYIEFDVRYTKDKKIVIFHDETLNRMTGLSRTIKDFNSKEIKTFRTKNIGSKILFLSEIFDKFKGKMNFMINLKQDELMKDVVNKINTINITANCVISRRNLSVLNKIYHYEDQIKICYNLTHGKDLSLKERDS
ncbi:MAG: glycerophosphodiester phosphodiesterase [Promethearchaeota archaeon]